MQVNSKALDNCESPEHAVCYFAKGSHLPDKINKTNKSPMKKQELKK